MASIKRLLMKVFALAACVTICAATFVILPAGTAFAADKPYTFTVTVNAGKEGTLTNGDTDKIKKFGPVENGKSVTITAADLGLEVNDSDTYYVRGLKLSGHDNDEAVTRHYQLPLTLNNVTEDMSLSVAYGIKGSMVKYTVSYEDEAGNPLRNSEEYYGMIGDYPVVSYQVVDGYLPDAYSKGKTLLADESQNVFRFTYSATNTATADNDNNQAAGANNAANNGNAGAGANNAANNGNAVNNGNAPADFQDLDNNAVPLNPDAGNNNSSGDGSSTIDDQETPRGIFGKNPMLFIVGGGLIAAAIAAVAFIRSRGYEYEDDDE